MKPLAGYQSEFGKAHYPWDKPEPEPVVWVDTTDYSKSAEQVLEEVWVEMNIPEEKRQEMRDSLIFMNWTTY